MGVFLKLESIIFFHLIYNEELNISFEASIRRLEKSYCSGLTNRNILLQYPIYCLILFSI